MKLAEGRSHQRRMMAAMGQLDCGQCGYLCKTYAEAIATGAEKDLTRCVPGGKPTAKLLKVLVAEAPPPVPPAVPVRWTHAPRRALAAGRSRAATRRRRGSCAANP